MQPGSPLGTVFSLIIVFVVFTYLMRRHESTGDIADRLHDEMD